MNDEGLQTRSPVHSTAWLLTAALLLFRLLPTAFQPGMFFDGVTHATIARNMAEGTGDFWHPVLFGPACDYHEQPTLAFWLESLMFRACGDHFWVEKLYSVLVALGTAALIGATWRLLFGKHSSLGDLAWLPVALWICLPSWAWMYDSNMLENTLGLFAIASVYASLRAARSTRAWLAWMALAAGCLACAVLSKGPVGLYPLITPLVVGLTLQREQKRRMLVIQEGLALLLLLCFGLLLMQRGAHDYLAIYFHDQVVASLSGSREIVHSRIGRLDILWRIITQLAPLAAIAAGVIYFARRRVGGEASGSRPNSELMFCLLTAASASLPIAISPKQSGHYAFPSYALYALALAAWCAPAVWKLLDTARGGALADLRFDRTQRVLRGLAVAGSAAVLMATFFLAGRPHRDKEIYHDSLAVGRLLPRESTVGLAPGLAEDYPIQMYMARWGGILLQPHADSVIAAGQSVEIPQYLLAALGADAPTGYTPVAADLNRYQLFERSTAAPRIGLGARSMRQ